MGGKRAITRADGDGKLVVVARNQLPLKMSVIAQFRGLVCSCVAYISQWGG